MKIKKKIERERDKRHPNCRETVLKLVSELLLPLFYFLFYFIFQQISSLYKILKYKNFPKKKTQRIRINDLSLQTVFSPTTSNDFQIFRYLETT